MITLTRSRKEYDDDGDQRSASIACCGGDRNLRDEAVRSTS